VNIRGSLSENKGEGNRKYGGKNRKQIGNNRHQEQSRLETTGIRNRAD